MSINTNDFEMYKELEKKAQIIAMDAHSNQYDKTGSPYINHIWRVSEMMDSPEATIVALLHDVIEDTDISYDYLHLSGFPDDIINSICLLTKTNDTNIDEYFKKIKSDPVARAVKIGDLSHNMDESRWEDPVIIAMNISEDQRRKNYNWFLKKRKEYEKWREFLLSDE